MLCCDIVKMDWRIWRLADKFLFSKEVEMYAYIYGLRRLECYGKLDPVGTTVRYEMMKLCTG